MTCRSSNTFRIESASCIWARWWSWRHPYTEALLAAIPTTDIGENRKELQILEGDIPSPVNPPKGCKFHTRCKYCTEICEQVVPEWKEVSENHFVACHHVLPEKHQ